MKRGAHASGPGGFDGARETVSSAWMFDTIRACQAFVGDATWDPPATLRSVVARFHAQLPTPVTPAEAVIQRLLLLELAHWPGELHASFHRRRPAPCPFVPSLPVQPEWRERLRPPADVFREWAFTFLDDFERAHRILSPDELIELLARESRHSLHVSGLARRLGMHPVRLRRLCRELLGMSPRAYCQRTRVWQALKHLADSHEKVDAVALEFGWRSKKNFYRAVRAVTGLTPRQVRLREFSKTDGAREGDRTRHVP